MARPLTRDRPHHLAQRWITYRRRSAIGDLFLGPYPAASQPRRTRPVKRAWVLKTRRKPGGVPFKKGCAARPWAAPAPAGTPPLLGPGLWVKWRRSRGARYEHFVEFGIHRHAR